MTHTKNLKSTFVLLKKLSPMLKIDEIDKYEKQNGMGQFDVFCKHKEGKKTMWGDEEIQFSSSTLRELANNLYDYLCKYSLCHWSNILFGMNLSYFENPLFIYNIHKKIECFYV